MASKIGGSLGGGIASGGLAGIGSVGGGQIGGGRGGIGAGGLATAVRIGGPEGARTGSISAKDMSFSGRPAFGFTKEGPAKVSNVRITGITYIKSPDTGANRVPSYAQPFNSNEFRPAPPQANRATRINSHNQDRAIDRTVSRADILGSTVMVRGTNPERSVRPTPLEQSLGQKGRNRFDTGASKPKTLRTEGIRPERVANYAPAPARRPLAESSRSWVRRAMEAGRLAAQDLNAKVRTEKAGSSQTSQVRVDTPEFQRLFQIPEPNIQPQPEIKPEPKAEISPEHNNEVVKKAIENPAENQEKTSQKREQALEASVISKFAKLFGSIERAVKFVASAKEQGKVGAGGTVSAEAKAILEAAQLADAFPARQQKLGLAKVLSGQPQVDAVAIVRTATQTEAQSGAQTGAASGVQSESGSKTETRTKEYVKTVARKVQKALTQKRQEEETQKESSSKTKIKKKLFQEYAQGLMARIQDAKAIFDRIQAENLAKGVDGVTGREVADEYEYTKAKESRAIAQLGREHFDGSELETRAHLASEKELTVQKISEISKAHAPTEVVDDLSTRKSTEDELAEIFSHKAQVPIPVDLGSGIIVAYATEAELHSEKITEQITGAVKERTDQVQQVATAPQTSKEVGDGEAVPNPEPAEASIMNQPLVHPIPTFQIPRNFKELQDYLKAA